MPLSKAKQAEYQRKRRKLGMTQAPVTPKSTKTVIPTTPAEPVRPKSKDVRPNIVSPKTFGYATKGVPAGPAWLLKDENAHHNS